MVTIVTLAAFEGKFTNFTAHNLLLCTQRPNV